MKKIILLTCLITIFILIGFNNSFPVPRNVLIEYLSGTWCGNCPCGHDRLNTINSMYPQTVVLAYHGYSNSIDPWRLFNGNEIITYLGFSGSPSATIDRNGINGYEQWITNIQNRYSSSPESNVNISVISKSYNMNTRQFDISLQSAALTKLSGQYKINIVISEDNLIYPQNHYSQCGTPGYDPDYIHHHVVRNMFNGALGENLNTNLSWNENEIITKNFSIPVDNSWDASNCFLTAFIYKENVNLFSAGMEQAIQTSVSGSTGVGNSNETPAGYLLQQNYPNPFNPTTNIKFSIPKAGKVSFKVYDIFGKEVENYIDGNLQSGTYNVEFHGANLSSGIYFYVLKTDNFVDKKKMVLVK